MVSSALICLVALLLESIIVGIVASYYDYLHSRRVQSSITSMEKWVQGCLNPFVKPVIMLRLENSPVSNRILVSTALLLAGVIAYFVAGYFPFFAFIIILNIGIWLSILKRGM